MSNDNCLEGIKCPQCGNEYRFLIVARIMADVTDNGADIADGYGIDWDDDSLTTCPECERCGPLLEFQSEREETDSAKKANEEMVPKWALDSQIDITNQLREHCTAVEKAYHTLRQSGDGVLRDLYGIGQVNPGKLTAFVTAMRETVIPEIEKTLREREEAWHKVKHIPLSAVKGEPA